MCLVVFSFAIIFALVLVTRTMVVRPQRLDSPCPDTFQYERDANGQIFGTIGVYSFDENVVRLNVELSVGNPVNNYNGQIQLANPKEQILDDIHRGRPVKYKLLFPQWENVPPKVTKIFVNGQVVCSGPPLPMGGMVNVLTTVNLQHTLTVKVQPLRSRNPFVPANEPSGSEGLNNPFLAGSKMDYPFLTEKNSGNGGKVGTVDFKSQGSTEGVVRTQFVDLFTTMGRTTARSNSRNSLPVANDVLFSENPFLSGRVPPISSVTTPKTGSKGVPPVSKSQEPSSDTCGVPVVPNPLVINGNDVLRGAFPWLAAMFAVTSTGLEYKCSGTLVSKKHIVTAAHCIQQGRQKVPADKLVFVLGKLNIKKWSLSDGEKMIEAQDTEIHPDYVPLSSDADIAVVILSEEVQFNKYVRPICLWGETDDIDVIVGLSGKVVGWGKDEHDNLMTAEPRQANIPVVSQEVCLRSSEAFKYITSSRTFCAGERNDSGPCNGDSGSGFIMKRNGKWFLRGVVSISTYDPVKQSCDLSNYVVFTDVSKFRSWLLNIIAS